MYRRMPLLERAWTCLAALVIVAILLFCGWVYYLAPCSWLQFEPAKNLPGRCVTYFTPNR